jgi:hypothetical protein
VCRRATLWLWCLETSCFPIRSPPCSWFYKRGGLHLVSTPVAEPTSTCAYPGVTRLSTERQREGERSTCSVVGVGSIMSGDGMNIGKERSRSSSTAAPARMAPDDHEVALHALLGRAKCLSHVQCVSGACCIDPYASSSARCDDAPLRVNGCFSFHQIQVSVKTEAEQSPSLPTLFLPLTNDISTDLIAINFLPHPIRVGVTRKQPH